MRRADDELLAAIGRDELFEATDPACERHGVARNVDHHPAVPLLGAYGYEAEVVRVEVGRRVEPRRRPQLSVRCIRPAVVRTVNGGAVRSRTARHQLVAAVAADVEERPYVPVVAADDDDRVVTDPHRPSGTRRDEIGSATRADPTGREEVFALPRQDGFRRVCLLRQHAAATGGIEGTLEGVMGKGSGTRRVRHLTAFSRRPFHRGSGRFLPEEMLHVA